MLALKTKKTPLHVATNDNTPLPLHVVVNNTTHLHVVQPTHTPETQETVKFSSLEQLLDYFKTEKDCIDYLIKMRWYVNGILQAVCPKCHKHNDQHNYERVHTYDNGYSFKCNDCERNFSYTVGTILQNTKKTLRTWFIAIYLFNSDKLGISTQLLSEKCEVTQTTATNMLQRLRYGFSEENNRFTFDVTSIIQIDEAIIRSENQTRPVQNKDVDCTGRSYQIESKIIIGIVDMITRRAKLFHVSTTEEETILDIVKTCLTPGCTVYSDEYTSYNNFLTYFKHKIVKHKKKQWANGNVSTNGVEGLWSLLKKVLKARYKHVKEKFIAMYLNEFLFRYNLRETTTEHRFNETIKVSIEKTATLYQIKHGLTIAA